MLISQNRVAFHDIMPNLSVAIFSDKCRSRIEGIVKSIHEHFANSARLQKKESMRLSERLVALESNESVAYYHRAIRYLLTLVESTLREENNNHAPDAWHNYIKETFIKSVEGDVSYFCRLVRETEEKAYQLLIYENDGDIHLAKLFNYQVIIKNLMQSCEVSDDTKRQFKQESDKLDRIGTTVFKLPLITDRGYCYYSDTALGLYGDKNYRLQPDNHYKKRWTMGDDYKRWVRGFFTCNTEIAVYQEKSEDLQEAILGNSPMDKITKVSDELKSIIVKLKSKILLERPQWRLFPPTLGWPFNKEARNFSEALLAVFDAEENKIKPALEIACKKAEARKLHNEQAPNIPENWALKQKINHIQDKNIEAQAEDQSKIKALLEKANDQSKQVQALLELARNQNNQPLPESRLNNRR